MRLLASRGFIWSVAVLSALAFLLLLNNFVYFAWLTAAPAVGSPSGGRSMTEAEVVAARHAANWTLGGAVALAILSVTAGVHAVRLGKKAKAA